MTTKNRPGGTLPGDTTPRDTSPPETPPRQCHLTGDSRDKGVRLDKFLADHGPELSRSHAKRLIEAGHLVSDGRTITDPNMRVKPGQCFTLTVPAAVAAEPEGQAIPLDIPYEDSDLLVIDKPAGLVVHPAPGNPDRTLVNALISHCGGSLSGIGGVARPGIVHRLDKDTSGLLIVAKNDLAHRALAEQLQSRQLKRIYLALVWGVPVPIHGRIEAPIGRNPKNRKKMAVVARGGRPAATNYRLRARFGDVASLVECRLETGRTHQIRVHLAHLGHPLLGDPVYGRRRPPGGLPAAVATAIEAFSRQALHAHEIGFNHPKSGKALSFKSALPNDFKDLIEKLETI